MKMNSFLVTSVMCIFAISATSAFPDSRIISGDLARGSQFPWHASITAVYASAPQRYFGGSLISQNFVLTIGHFMVGAQNTNIKLGSVEFSRPLISVESKTYFIHPNFNANTFSFDVALIKLPYNLQYTVNCQPITLPARAQSSNQFVGANAIISGFGVTSPDSGYLSEQLRFARVTVISDTQCAQTIPIFVQPTLMCAVSPNHVAQSGTACFGDTGGALVINEGNAWTQIGLANLYPNGCTATLPTMYSRLTYVLDWIANVSGVPVRS